MARRLAAGLLILVAIGLVVVAVMATWYRPLLFASIDPEAAAARGVPVRRLGLIFLFVLALTVTGAAQVVGTLLVLSLAITPAAAAQRLSARPLVVAALSVVFAVAAADGGLLASFGASNIKASVFITSISFAIYLAARLTGPCSGTAASTPAKTATPSRMAGHTRATDPGRRAPALRPRRREATDRRNSRTDMSPRDSAGPAALRGQPDGPLADPASKVRPDHRRTSATSGHPLARRARCLRCTPAAGRSRWSTR